MWGKNPRVGSGVRFVPTLPEEPACPIPHLSRLPFPAVRRAAHAGTVRMRADDKCVRYVSSLRRARLLGSAHFTATSSCPRLLARPTGQGRISCAGVCPLRPAQEPSSPLPSPGSFPAFSCKGEGADCDLAGHLSRFPSLILVPTQAVNPPLVPTLRPPPQPPPPPQAEHQ